MSAARFTRAMAPAILSLLIPIASFSATYTIRPDGTGDFPTIQAGIDASVDGDVIQLSDGSFTGDGNWDIEFLGKEVVVRSESGDPSSCRIVASQEYNPDPHRAFVLHGYETRDAVIEGISMVDGTGEIGGAMHIYNHASPTIRNCLFSMNEASQGGAVYATFYAEPLFEDCTFQHNVAEVGGAIGGGDVTLTRCAFESNRASEGGACKLGGVNTLTECSFVGNAAGPAGGGAIRAGRVVMTACVFDGNSSDDVGGGAIVGENSTVHGCVFVRNTATVAGGLSIESGIVDHCTFSGNHAMHEGSALQVFGSLTIENSIIAFGVGDQPVDCAVTSDLSVSCTDVFGDYAGAYVDCMQGLLGVNGNITADPAFCDQAAGDLTLRADSPCAPGDQPVCGLIGALGVGCDNPVPVLKTTWGRVRSDFR